MRVNIGGSRIAVPIPVAYSDQPPDGADGLIFDSISVPEWASLFTAIDLPAARRLAHTIGPTFKRWADLLIQPPL